MRRRPAGFTLIEVLITLSILGVLLALAAPSYSVWIANLRIRTAADSIVSGLQLARAEAVRRNSLTFFKLVTTLDNSCRIARSNTWVRSTWIVSLNAPWENCAAARLNDAFPITDTGNNPPPRIIQARPAAEGTTAVPVRWNNEDLAFNGRGQSILNRPVLIEVGNCAVTTDLRCLSVTVSAVGGQIRMCDPALAAGDPQAC